MARKKIYQMPLMVILMASLIDTVYSQDTTQRLEMLQPNPNNASIEGRVVLPSGNAADFNIKVTLSNQQSTLTTLYTDKHGEFKFLNMSEGTYYVQASVDSTFYEPVVEKVRLDRSQIVHLTIALRRKEETTSRSSGPGVISAAEFDQQVPAAARKAYNRATKLIGQGKRLEAIEHLKQAIALYPDYLIARNDLGVQYLKLKRLDEAAEQFQKVTESHPKYFNSRLNLGLVLIEQKKFTDAISQLHEAISIDSSRPAAHLWLGIALLQTYELSQAERALTRALITGGANFVVAHYYLAQVHIKKGERSEAAQRLKAYLEEAPRGEHVEEARLLLKRLEPIP